MRQKVKFHLLGVFLASFFFIFASYAGLPADYPSDYLKDIEGARSTSYLDFFRLIFNPFTPAWFYPPDTRLLGYLRPLLFLLKKIYFEQFGYGNFSFHVTAAIGFGILNGILFAFIFWATGSFLFAWLGGLLYASFPSNFFLHDSIQVMDFQHVVSILSILSLFLFGLLTFARLQSRARFLTSLFAWVLTAWLAIKLKSTEKILPGIFLGFLFLRLRSVLSRIGLRRVLLLFLTTLAMTPLVVPFRPFQSWIPERSAQAEILHKSVSKKDQVALSFSGRNLIQRTFFVPGGEFPFLTPHRRKVPRSFTENYGFFLGWIFWLGWAWLVFVLIRSKLPEWSRKGSLQGEATFHGLWLVLVWFGLTLLGFGTGNTVNEVRFLNFGFVPSILLFFGGIVGLMEERGFQAPKRRFLFRALVTGLVLYTSLTNFGFFSKLLVHFGGIQDARYRADRDVFRAFYGEEPVGLSLYERHSELETHAILIDWFELPDDWFEKAQEKLEREKKLYLYVRASDSERLRRFQEAGYRVSLWNRYDFFEARPLAFRLFQATEWVKSWYKKRKKREILVYLIEARPPALFEKMGEPV